jgi:hypothetical protein
MSDDSCPQCGSVEIHLNYRRAEDNAGIGGWTGHCTECRHEWVANERSYGRYAGPAA